MLVSSVIIGLWKRNALRSTKKVYMESNNEDRQCVRNEKILKNSGQCIKYLINVSKAQFILLYRVH